jgi:hypothetical protein
MTEQHITIRQARSFIERLAAHQSLLLLSAPGIGKSDIVHQAAASAGLECRSLLGTQIAPEDVSGIPRIVGERSVFCPPRVLLPEDGKAFCLFLDELPAATADIQKAFYALLLERRIGEFELPAGSWVVAAGNRTVDRALVRSMSSALVNRVLILHVEANHKEWLVWAAGRGIRADILAFITYMPESLMRPVPKEPIPFSTPRAWASLSRALDLVEQKTPLRPEVIRALAFGRVSPEDAALFCALADSKLAHLLPVEEYIYSPSKLPPEDTARWFIIHHLRQRVKNQQLLGFDPMQIDTFLWGLPREFRFAVLVDLVPQWSDLGASESMFRALREVTGL